MSLYINTDAVNAVAQNLQKINNDIEDSFPELVAAINSMGNNWDGEAAETASDKFFAMKENYQESRYNVIQNYANYLTSIVEEGYCESETANKARAEGVR